MRFKVGDIVYYSLVSSPLGELTVQLLKVEITDIKIGRVTLFDYSHKIKKVYINGLERDPDFIKNIETGSIYGASKDDLHPTLDAAKRHTIREIFE